MLIAPIPNDEAQRLATLHAHAILDTPPDEAFDDIARLAAELCGTPVAMISLVDRERQWFKAKVGVDATETPRDISFCGHTICQDGLFTVEDAARDHRFHDNPLVLGEPHVRFYAAMPLRSPGGHALGALCIVDREPRAITEDQGRQLRMLARQACRLLNLHHLLSRSRKAATCDDLTGLSNRRGLLDQLEVMIREAGDCTEQRVAVAFLDLDRFKRINDTRGHEAGDAVLCATGRRMNDIIETITNTHPLEAACVARLGGDEFIAAVRGRFEPAWLEHTLGPWLIYAVSQPVHWQGRQLACGASLGFAVDEGPGGDAEAMLRHADIAMYKAKEGSGRRCVTFSTRMEHDLLDGLEREAALRQVLSEGKLHTCYRPVIDLQSGQVAGFEAMVAGDLPPLRGVSSAALFETAQQAGLVQPLFEALLSDALETLYQWRTRFGAWVCLPVSAGQLEDVSFRDNLTARIAAAGIEPGAVVLAVCESDVTGGKQIIGALHALRGSGLGLMLDRFGAAAGSLTALHRCPVQWLRIAPQCLGEAGDDRERATIIEAMARLGGNLGLATIATGVNEPRQIAMVQAMDFDCAQGDALGGPVTSAEAASLLNRPPGTGHRAA